MNQNTPHNNWKSVAARLIVVAASIGGLTTLIGCDQRDGAQIATDLVSGNPLGNLDAYVNLSKDFSQMRLASNHNETFLLG